MNTATGAQLQTITTDTGNFTLAELPAGVYDMTVEAPGFKKAAQNGIRVQVAQTARLDIGSTSAPRQKHQ
ncbi:MAG TPA: carboxypeptidase-like regulatory domain-containing protein [Bryobacteraceae bacterium]|nr:carboxypeptidase-like regulatory domain-containing protein [Bryobacteraceae bacterium]